MITKIECPNCEGDARDVWQDQEFPCGQPPVILKAPLPVIECSECDEKFTDWRGERIRESIVNAYLQGAGK